MLRISMGKANVYHIGKLNIAGIYIIGFESAIPTSNVSLFDCYLYTLPFLVKYKTLKNQLYVQYQFRI